MNSRILERMRKVLALAQQGEGGERETAERMLEALCKKYGVSIEQLEGQSKAQLRWIYCNSSIEKRLVLQVVDMFVDDAERRVTWTNKSRSRAVGYYLTDSEHAQVTVALETYKEAWKEQLENFFSAFVWKNKIYGERDRGQNEISDEEQERINKIYLMMQGIESVSVLPRLK